MTTETTLFHGTWPFFRTTIKWAECSSETASSLVFVGPCAAEEDDEDIFLEGDNDVIRYIFKEWQKEQAYCTTGSLQWPKPAV